MALLVTIGLVIALGLLLEVVAGEGRGVDSTPPTGLGSCLAVTADPDMFEPIDCSDDRAFYEIVNVVSDPEMCENITYFRDGASILCTKAVYDQ